MKDAFATLPARFQRAIEKVAALERHERYQGVFVFGSAARGDVNEKSDLDVQVVVSEGICDRISHPSLEGVMCDIAFLSYDQLAEREIKKSSGRIPMLAESLILFDKTGRLTELKRRVENTSRPALSQSDYRHCHFLVSHINDKVERNITTDPDMVLLVMHSDLKDLLAIHYALHRKWQVSSKRILNDLAQWDASLACLLKEFLNTQDVHAKYEYWRAIIDHIAAPVGGISNIENDVCACVRCRKDIEMLLR